MATAPESQFQSVSVYIYIVHYNAVELLADLLDAHGGLDNWNRVDSLSAQLVLGGGLFLSMVGWPEAEPRPTATLGARREHMTLAPFGARSDVDS